MHFQVCRSVLLSGLWDLKDTLKSQQNRSKNIRVGEHIVIREYGGCSLPGECTVHSVSTNIYVGINQSLSLTLYTDYYSFKIFLCFQLVSLIKFGRPYPYSENDVNCTG